MQAEGITSKVNKMQLELRSGYGGFLRHINEVNHFSAFSKGRKNWLNL